MSIKIFTDSTCDLSPQILMDYDIRRLPLAIIMGEREYKDGVDISPQDIINFVDSGKGTSHTGAINTEEYQLAYREELEAGADAIIHFTISAELSSCYDNAEVTAREFPEVYVIDTRSLSTGGGWLALYAAELAELGLDAATIAERCEQKKRLADTSFVINTLEYLHKGGRCSGLAALGADLLKLRPCLELRGGNIEVGKKYRGSMKKIIQHYLRDRLEGQSGLDLRRAFITHTFYDDPQTVADAVALTQELAGFEEVLITEAGCTVCNHCGPGTLGVLFYRS